MNNEYLKDPEFPNLITINSIELDEIITTLKHAEIFISSRQKMHVDGIKLHKGLRRSLETKKSEPGIEP